MSIWSEGSPEHIKRQPVTSAHSDEQKERKKRTVMQPKPSELHIIQIIDEAYIRRRYDAFIQLPIVRDRVGWIVEFRTVNVCGVSQRDQVRLPTSVNQTPKPSEIGQNGYVVRASVSRPQIGWVVKCLTHL